MNATIFMKAANIFLHAPAIPHHQLPARTVFNRSDNKPTSHHPLVDNEVTI